VISPKRIRTRRPDLQIDAKRLASTTAAEIQQEGIALIPNCDEPFLIWERIAQEIEDTG
jgi:hypothetical protein